MQLNGRVALITGGRRVGASVAVELARRGADIALSYNHSRDEAEATAVSVRELGRRAVVCQANLTDAESCRLLVASVLASWAGSTSW